MNNCANVSYWTHKTTTVMRFLLRMYEKLASNDDAGEYTSRAMHLKNEIHYLHGHTQICIKCWIGRLMYAVCSVCKLDFRRCIQVDKGLELGRFFLESEPFWIGITNMAFHLLTKDWDRWKSILGAVTFRSKLDDRDSSRKGLGRFDSASSVSEDHCHSKQFKSSCFRDRIIESVFRVASYV